MFERRHIRQNLHINVRESLDNWNDGLPYEQIITKLRELDI